MTECERIIENGILPSSFFEEETICDFLVTKERKKLWAILIDLLIQFDIICRKHNLKYVALGGTLLGVVRHRGFIPWDDDIDVGMPREDYEKFLEIAPKELDDPYFLQIPGKDKDYFFGYAKFNNSNTTAISHCFRYCTHNHGIFLDVFPLDNIDIDKLDEYYKKENDLILENSANMRRSNPYPSERDIEKMSKYEERDPKEVLAELNEMHAKSNENKSEYCKISGCTVYSPQRLVYKWSDLLDLTEADFYGHRILVPKDTHSVLRRAFGENYMQFPPIEERGKWHGSIYYNADIPYKEYIKELREHDVKEK